jgi:hypothetical protein
MQVALRIKEDIEQRKSALAWGAISRKAFWSPNVAMPLLLYTSTTFSLS